MSAKELAIKKAADKRAEMLQAIRDYADALWEMQDAISGNDPEQCVLGDMIIVSHFTPLDRAIRDNMGEFIPSPQYILLTPRELPSHAMIGLLNKGLDLVAEDEELAAIKMYPEDFDD